MCIILFGFKKRDDFPLVIAANRDEFYQRPTQKAAVWNDYPHIYAGRDLVSKGTWIGVTDSGRFAAVTNFRAPGQPDGTHSRGDLVADFLKQNVSPREYVEHIKTRAEEFTGFNLLAGELNNNRSELFYYSNRVEEPLELSPGVYGLSNHLLDTPWPKVSKGKTEFRDLISNPAFEPESFFELMSNRTIANDDELPETGVGIERERILSPIFIKTPVYGTRCTTLLTINKEFVPKLDERTFV